MAAIVAGKADAEGRFTPESVWQAWGDWEFGQKNRPSTWLTFLVWKQLERAIGLLEGIGPGRLHLEQELYRLKVLESAWATKDKERAVLYRDQAEVILEQNQAQTYYDKSMAPLLQALDKGK